jgi:fumarate reductase subunit D
MPACSVCGMSAGYLSIHDECERKVADGNSPGDIRAEIRRRAGQVANESLYASTRRLTTLAAILFPVIIIIVAAASLDIFNTKDDELTIIALIAGVVAGVLIAWLFFTWMQMQAHLARRIAQFLDER